MVPDFMTFMKKMDILYSTEDKSERQNDRSIMIECILL